MLPGDHHEIVLPRILAIIDVSLSQLSDLFPSSVYLLVFSANLASEPSVVVIELPRVFLLQHKIITQQCELHVLLVDHLLLFRDGFLMLFRNLFDTFPSQPLDKLDSFGLL